MVRRGGRGRGGGAAAAAPKAEPSFVIAEDSDDADADALADDGGDDSGDGGRPSQFAFSQVGPDQSQYLAEARDAELRRLEALNPATRNQIVTSLSRALLFKALGGDVIDRTKVVADVLPDDLKREGIKGALLHEASGRLRDVFGFEVRHVPAKMEEDLPARFGNRLYVINDVDDDDDGTHSLNLHAAHDESSVERGVLMMVLAFAFCRGHSQVRSGKLGGAGKKTRWITEHHLYALMHRVDENVPGEPPSAEGRRRSRGLKGRESLSPGEEGGAGQTPDVDALLEKFVAQDYLLRDRIDEVEEREAHASEDGKVTAYAMGPRAAMEVGRKQVVYFCSNVLEQEPDPTMLNEIDEDFEDEEEEEEDEEEEAVEEVEEEEPKGRKRSKK